MIDGAPVVQCRPKMVDENENADIGWTGMGDETNHTFLFPSEKGVPDIRAVFHAGDLPDAITRKSENHSNLTDMKTKLFPALQQLFPYVHLPFKQLTALF